VRSVRRGTNGVHLLCVWGILLWESLWWEWGDLKGEGRGSYPQDNVGVY
jgi:hypothetical protein